MDQHLIDKPYKHGDWRAQYHLKVSPRIIFTFKVLEMAEYPLSAKNISNYSLGETKSFSVYQIQFALQELLTSKCIEQVQTSLTIHGEHFPSLYLSNGSERFLRALRLDGI